MLAKVMDENEFWVVAEACCIANLVQLGVLQSAKAKRKKRQVSKGKHYPFHIERNAVWRKSRICH